MMQRRRRRRPLAAAPPALLLPVVLLGLALVHQARALTEYLDAAAIALTEVG